MNGALLQSVFCQPVGIAVPLILLSLHSNEDRVFVEQMYFEYRQLMYMIARRYFDNDPQEIEDAISNTLEYMCTYVERFRAVERANLRNYVLTAHGNVCRRRAATLKRYREKIERSFSDDQLGNLPDPEDAYISVFDQADAQTLLQSFHFLSEGDKELIRMRYIDQMDYEEIARLLGMSQGAVRTAVARAKKRIREMAARKE